MPYSVQSVEPLLLSFILHFLIEQHFVRLNRKQYQHSPCYYESIFFLKADTHMMFINLSSQKLESFSISNKNYQQKISSSNRVSCPSKFQQTSSSYLDTGLFRLLRNSIWCCKLNSGPRFEPKLIFFSTLLKLSPQNFSSQKFHISSGISKACWMLSRKQR